MRTWWQLVRQREWLSLQMPRGRRRVANSHIISDRALRIAAEVLEPRCLMTDATGLAADDGSGDILVDASRWDDAGLTLLRDNDLVHLVRTGTTQDVIAPFAADAPGRLVIQGRDGASDVLTIDVSGAIYQPNYWLDTGTQAQPTLLAKEILFDGGRGSDADEFRIVGSLENDAHVTFQPAAIGHFSSARFAYLSGSELFDITYRQVEVATESLAAGSVVFLNVEFGMENNVITVELKTDAGMRRISDPNLGIAIQSSIESWTAPGVDAGGGDDQITVVGSDLSFPDGFWSNFPIDGGAGNDLLIGSAAADQLYGGLGDDSIDGQAGQDWISGGPGNDVIDGGLGEDHLTDGSFVEKQGIKVGTDTMKGVGNDRFKSIEAVAIGIGPGSLIDASAFPGSSMFLGLGGNCTLIGGAGDDELQADGGNNLLIGGGGNDYLKIWYDTQTDTLVGGPGLDTINGVLEVDDNGIDEAEYHLQSDIVFGDSSNDILDGSIGVTTDDAPSDIAAGNPGDETLDSNFAVDDVEPIPNAMPTLIVSPPANTLLGQGLNEQSDEDATLPETLVIDAESDGEDSGLNDSANPDLARDAADDSTATDSASVSWAALVAEVPALGEDLPT